jgi:hypothetical protein
MEKDWVPQPRHNGSPDFMGFSAGDCASRLPPNNNNIGRRESNDDPIPIDPKALYFIKQSVSDHQQKRGCFQLT